MNKYLNQLVELCEHDKELDSFKPKIEAAQARLNSKVNQIDKAKNEIDVLNSEIEELSEQISLTNAQIAELNAKSKSSAKKSASLKTEKEIKALSVEVDITKEQLSAANEQIDRLEKHVETKKALIADLETQKSAFEVELDEIKAEVSTQMGEVEESRSKIYSIREKLIKSMDPKTVSFYEKIRKWASNTAVVPVRKQACYGCFMRLNDRVYSAVIKSDDIVTCPYCGRILYKEAE
ncbi:zinc ribbon domain-containing protein [Campylobacter sp. VBCF_02 NA5]|uniref:zinc ribbon domain-containing protein n=1 Tax=Campylobacter sp. VBCF_02 NA5 TaxID=2983834 RepID=UPI0022E9EEA3|nr:zinc ribbon domain-containing protein [Campylobacter sp. VBCF_02 NA5]MDA3060548.1 zinc ribbon domain-containing protein [Campylobacter sp. VBCF_02 NA5]